MIKCVCQQACQTRNLTGRIQFYKAGEVAEFEEVPPLFKAVEEISEEGVDFGNASEEELMATTWKLSELQKFAKEEYGVDIPFNDGDKKQDVVDRLLDAKYRKVD